MPFRGKNEFEVLEGHCALPVPAMRKTVTDIPAYAEAVILKALEKNRDDRHQTMAELGAALKDARERGERGETDAPKPEPTDSAPVASTEPPKSGTNTTLLYILAAVLVVAIHVR